MRAIGGRHKSNLGPTLNLFDFDRYPPSVDNLSVGLTINGSTVYPSFRYNGKHANSSIWKPWGYGKNLVLEAGTAPSYNQGSPLMGKNDDSVLLNGGGYYLSSDNDFGSVSINDIVFHILFNPIASKNIVAKRNAGVGWQIGVNATPALYLTIQDAGGSVTVTGGTLVASVWYDAWIFVDRSGSAQIYINGVASGVAVDFSARSLTLDSATALAIGADSNGALVFTSFISLIELYNKSSWLDTHIQTTLAAERFYRLTGVYPQQSRGTAAISTYTRASSAHMDKYESIGTRKLYLVGSGWPRTCERQESNTSKRLKGFLSETAATNLALQSQTFNSWIVIQNASVPVTSVVCPDGVARTTNTLHEDATAAALHLLAATINVTDTLVFSVWAKAANRNWLALGLRDGSRYACFNLSLGVIGTIQANTTAAIEDWGNGWYRCIIRADHTSGTGAAIYVGEADNDTTLDGLNQDSLYLFGAQVETGIYPTSYIPTTTGTVTKVADVLQFNSNNMSANKGTISCDILYPSYTDDTARLLLDCSDGTNTNRVSLYQTADHLGVDFKSAGDNTNASGSTDLVAGTIKNIKLMYDKTQLRATVNKTSEISPTSKTAAPTITTIGIGNNYGSVKQTNTIISNIKITSVSNDQKR